MKYAFPCVCVAGAVILKALDVDHGLLIAIGCVAFLMASSFDR